MNSRSHARLARVNPVLREKVLTIAAVLELEFGCAVEVTQGLRTLAEQDELYAQGRTRPGKIVTYARGGQSFHNYGLAVDLCPFVEGKPVWNNEGFWARLAVLAKQSGLVSGYFWRRQDKPHVQLGTELPR